MGEGMSAAPNLPWTRAGTDWLHNAGWGLMIHYLADNPGLDGPRDLTVGQWNRRVDGFDVPGLVGQLREMGSGYVIFTAGQCSGFFCSPNRAYDERAGVTPSRLSERDLIGELGDALTRAGLRLITYLPSHAPSRHREAVEALACTPEWDARMWGLEPGAYVRRRPVDERLTEFQRHWESVIREWSIRWGRNNSGWWFDGCYYADRMYRHADEPNFRSFAAHAKAGNAESLVAFNPGVLVPVICNTPYEDYTAGESDVLPTFYGANEPGRFINGAQLHVLSYLGRSWGQGEQPRYSDDLVTAYTDYINTAGGAVTWEVPVDPKGRIPPPFFMQLRCLGEARRLRGRLGPVPAL